ncbi:MAG: pyridoxamine 5'-phosphate oxidase family protein, partial [Acinetobacter sp.]
MISEKDWKNIQQVFKAAQKASLHSSIATVDQFGQPSITPIGTVFLNEDQT